MSTKESTSPTTSTPSSATRGVRDLLREDLDEGPGVDRSFGPALVVSSSGEPILGMSGIRISGVGPEKSFPVNLDSVSMSFYRDKTIVKPRLNHSASRELTIGRTILEAFGDTS